MAATAAAKQAAQQAEQLQRQLLDAEERLAEAEEAQRQRLVAAKSLQQQLADAEDRLATAEEGRRQHLADAEEWRQQLVATMEGRQQDELAAAEERHLSQLAAVQQACADAQRQAADSAASAAEWRQQAAVLRQQLEAVNVGAGAVVSRPTSPLKQQPGSGQAVQLELSESEGSGLIPAGVVAEEPASTALDNEAQSSAAHRQQHRDSAVSIDGPPSHGSAAAALQLQVREQQLQAEHAEEQRRHWEAHHATLQALEAQQAAQMAELLSQCQQAEAAAAALRQELTAAAAQHAQRLAALQEEHSTELEEVRVEAAAAAVALEQQHAQQLDEVRRQHAEGAQQAELHGEELQLLLQQQSADAAAASAAAASTRAAWGAAAAVAGSSSRDSTPSPIQRRFQQRLRQLAEQHEEELHLLQQRHEEQLAAERLRAADAAQAALLTHRRQLESVDAEHEELVRSGRSSSVPRHVVISCLCCRFTVSQRAFAARRGLETLAAGCPPTPVTLLISALVPQLKEERRRHEAASDAAELQHLMELEAAVEGSFLLDGLSGDSLAERLRALEARRVKQEGELEVLRWAWRRGGRCVA